MQPGSPKRPPTLVSFSGVDGAGKSTQINALCDRLRNMGMKVTLIRFWDDVSRLKAIRETTGHKLFKGDKGVGSPESPITRKDKNVQSWPMTCVRLALYFIDAVSARSAVGKALRSDADLIIFDRYCYDELANLNLQNPFVRNYVDLLLKLIPKLDKSYLLDADPLQARTRKPEYPLDFVYQNRAAYLQLQKSTGRLSVISPLGVKEVEQEIWRQTSEVLQWPWVEDRNRGFLIEKQPDETNNLGGPYTRPAA